MKSNATCPIIVTGAAQGLGRAFAKRFAEVGHAVVVADIRGETAEALAEEIRCSGGSAIAFPLDVTDAASATHMVQTCCETFGGLGVLVNNASVFSTLKMRPFDEIPVAEWRHVINVNLTGVYLCSRAAAPPMKAARWGRIVNIASAAVPMGRPHYLHYVSSKAGVIGLTRGLAKELGEWNITVNAVLPGATDTEIERETVTPQQRENLISARSIRRAQGVDDLTGVVQFIASDECGFVTGQSLVVDGGTVFL